MGESITKKKKKGMTEYQIEKIMDLILAMDDEETAIVCETLAKKGIKCEKENDLEIGGCKAVLL